MDLKAVSDTMIAGQIHLLWKFSLFDLVYNQIAPFRDVIFLFLFPQSIFFFSVPFDIFF